MALCRQVCLIGLCALAFADDRRYRESQCNTVPYMAPVSQMLLSSICLVAVVCMGSRCMRSLPKEDIFFKPGP